jgi:hypothetical protein
MNMGLSEMLCLLDFPVHFLSDCSKKSKTETLGLGNHNRAVAVQPW